MEIVLLDKDSYQNTKIHFEYETNQYYDVIINNKDNVIAFELILKDFDVPQKRWFEDTLYQSYNRGAKAYGIFEEGLLIAAIEVKKEPWGNRLRIVNLWVKEEYRNKGCGSQLIEHALHLAKRSRCRAIALETQSCDVPAIRFYQRHGFSFIGVDTTCYTDRDIEDHDVSLEMGLSLR